MDDKREVKKRERGWPALTGSLLLSQAFVILHGHLSLSQRARESKQRSSLSSLNFLLYEPLLIHQAAAPSSLAALLSLFFALSSSQPFLFNELVQRVVLVFFLFINSSLFSPSWLLYVLFIFYCSSSFQALQALQRQPNAAQYFQQLMLQQQINSAQLQNLAAVQQVKVCDALSLCFQVYRKKYLFCVNTQMQPAY